MEKKTMTEKQPSKIQKFMERLERYVQQDDRGALADLRRGFSRISENRAWPYISGWCSNLADDKDRNIWLIVGAGFAAHGRTARQFGNMGKTLRMIAKGDDPNRVHEALKSFEGRFRRLLTCTTTQELCCHLPGIIRAAKQKEVSVDFEKLFWDLLLWENPEKKIKLKWAEAYWASDTPAEGGDAS